MTDNRPKTGQFQKGQSGNPKGRPKQTPEQKEALQAIRELAQETPKVLKEIMLNRKAPAAIRLKAVEIILNRTYGHAETSITVEKQNNYDIRELLDSLTDEQLEAYQMFCESIINTGEKPVK